MRSEMLKGKGLALAVGAGLSLSVLAAVFVLRPVAWMDDSGSGMDHAAHRSAMAANLERRVIVSRADASLELPALTSTNGTAMADQFQGRWSLVFFGYTSCPHVCPATLGSLAKASRLPASGFDDGSTQLLFVTVDPGKDTLERVGAYVSGFHEDFIGYTGSADAIAMVTERFGAAFEASENNIDHSTSLFVVDPTGRPAGVLLRPTDPRRLVDDLADMRRTLDAAAAAPLVASRGGVHVRP